jgi:hypothetical protein
MVLARIGIGTRRSGSVENRLDVIACNTSGLIRVVSINQIVMSLQKLLTLCFDGTVMRRNATSIY